MLNPIMCLKEMKFKLERNSNIKFATVFSKEKIQLDPSKNFVIAEVKNVVKSKMHISLKIYVNQTLGYEQCFKTIEQIVEQLKTLSGFCPNDLQILAITCDEASKMLCQELKIVIQQPKKECLPTLTFGDEKMVVRLNTSLKIERQISPLGVTIFGTQLHDFQKPIKKIEGSAAFNETQFNRLNECLMSKKIKPITFQKQSFNAVLIELVLNAGDVINFTFLEAVKNEN